MKSIITLLAFVASATIAQAATIVVGCKPVTKTFPFNSFQLSVQEQNGKAKTVSLLAEFSKLADGRGEDENEKFSCTSVENKNDDSCTLSIDKEKNSAYVGKDRKGKSFGTVEELNIYADMEWAGVAFDLAQDDEGLSAFLDFKSDGPAIRSFYRCTESLK